MGFVGGIILTYLCFMFFVFQLSISLIHATIMSSIIGVLLTLGLAFSYRIRCLVFLLIPQFFSRVGRYTLTCYALVLILTGPATNTLKNSEVLSESMACSQEQIKTSVHQLNDLMKRPFNALKDSLKLMMDRLKKITARVKETIIRIDRLVLSVVSVIHSSFSWLQSITNICNAKLGTPYERCSHAMAEGIADCKKTLGPDISKMCNVAYVAEAACYSVKPFTAFCYATDFILDEAILAGVRKKLKNFSEHLRAMFHVEVHMSHAYSFSSNTSRSASQVAAGIVTEIRNRADPLLTWLSWSSCVTSLFLLLIIFRAKYYQHMYETRSRFDNRYVTRELQELDLKRQRQGRETVLPLNRRERAKYITTTSFRLVASEKVYLNRSAVFMAITTFKLLIHMVADYSLYWVLMTIRYHGRYQSDVLPGIPHTGVHVTGSGFVARLFKSIINILDIPLSFTAPSPISCLPDPYPPDLRRYTQIGVLIFLLWFFALFEPYGLRLRHLIMGHYRPERAKARATWLYNHILRTRASFMKFARRKLHREYKYSSQTSPTFRQWVAGLIPFQCCRSLVGLGPSEEHCLLCGITSSSNDPDSQLTRCQTPDCPGVFCISCFTDIGELCTICLSPADYGDLSDISFEKGSSDDSDSDDGIFEHRPTDNLAMYMSESSRSSNSTSSERSRRWQYFTTSGPKPGPLDSIALIHTTKYDRDIVTSYFVKQFRNMKSNMKIRCWDKKYTLDWVSKHTSECVYKELEAEENLSLDSEQIAELNKVVIRTKSIGVNTDRNRGVLLSMLLKSFRRRKLTRFRNKEKNSKPNRKQYKRLSHTENVEKPKTHANQVVQYNTLSADAKSLISSQSLNGHNLAIRQRNLKSVVRGKKDTTRKDKQKVYEELKGIIKAIRQFLKSNDVIEVSNQNNEVTPNNNPVEENQDVTKPLDNTGIEEKKNKRKGSKNNKIKRPRKSKDLNKSKTKNSRHRISAFHTFFSNHWNNFKCSLMPCTAQNRSDSPISKEKRNHKRRKKRKDGIYLNETDIEECFARKDIKHTRNLRISAFLAELEWTKRDYRKDKECEGMDDSFFLTDGPPPLTTNKIVGMVQLKNLPFQWREAPNAKRNGPKLQLQQEKKAASPILHHQSDKYLKIFTPLSKQKIYPNKKSPEKVRNKVRMVDTPHTSFMHKMMSTLNATRDKSPVRHESSIYLSKRASFYRQFTKELTEQSDALDTDMLFKNDNFLTDVVEDPIGPNDVGGPSKFEFSNSLVGKELIISRSSKHSTKVGKRCKCEIYDDLQKKWAHVKKLKNPVSTMRNFCSSLFGPSCTVETCPNKDKKSKKSKPKKPKKEKKVPKGQKATLTQTDKRKKPSKKASTSIQTQKPHKDTETQLAEDTDIERETSHQHMPEKNEHDQVPDELNADNLSRRDSVCPEQKTELKTCMEKERERMMAQLQKTLSTKVDCPNYCHRESQYSKADAKEAIKMKKNLKKNKGVGSVKCLCADKSVQDSSKGTLCTCATQHDTTGKNITTAAVMASSRSLFEKGDDNPVAHKYIQHREMAHKGTDYINHRLNTKKGKDTKASLPKIRCEKLSLESSLCMQLKGEEPLQDLTDTLTDTSISSISLRSEETKTDTTICSLATVDFDDMPRRRKFRVKVVTKTNQATLTDKTRLCDTGTITNDWWSPIIERKGNDEILLEKKKGFNAMEKQKKELKELKDWKELKEVRKRRRNCGVTTDGRIVTFRSRTQIIPAGLFPGVNDIMSPSRYLLESQKYYNELFAYNFRMPQGDYNCFAQMPKFQDREKARSPLGSRRSEEPLQDLTDTLTDTSISSISLRSEETKTDTTICSLATVDFDDMPRRRKFRVKVVTKTNQATLTDKTRLCDTGTITNDWWSPIIERKGNDEILLEKKKGFNAMEKQKKELKELKDWKELKEVRKRRRNCGVTTDGRIVTFRSRTQIIPAGLFPGVNDIMSPSRYLLESQKYYNELFAYNFRMPQGDYNCFAQMPKFQDREKARSPLGSRRNHHRKTKRLDECYSPRRQLSPRKRHAESTKTSDSPRRRPYVHRYSNSLVFLIRSDTVHSKSKTRKFPSEFWFGASSSAYQIEGGWDEDGKAMSIWDVACHRHPSPIRDDSTGDVSADSYHKYRQDIAAAVDLSLDFYRFSISWPRVLPNGFGDKINQYGIEYYSDLIDELISKNITPMVTIYHWDLPYNLQKLGGWVNPSIVEWFLDYAKFLFERYGEKVKYWITINDPKEICVSGYGSDTQAPFLNVSGNAEYLCARNILLAHAKVYHMYDQEYRKLQNGSIGLSLGFVWYEAASDTSEDHQAALDAKQFEWGLYAHPIFSIAGDFPDEVKKSVAFKSAEQGYPRSRLPELTPKEVTMLKGSADFLGVNSFTTKLAYRDASLEGMYHVPSYMDDMGAVLVKDPSWTQSHADWLQEVPWGFFKVLMEIKTLYDNPPVYVTANGWPSEGGLLDEDRIRYIRNYLNALLDAVSEGCDIRGYSMWSLIDAFEWRYGYLHKFGLYQVDFSSSDKSRTPRKSAFIYKEIVKSKALDPDYEPEKFIVEVIKESQERSRVDNDVM
uniref:Uncharacterized protein n=1 Tax=Heliothis virescens TaxID=7102 RepID=A0A2A4JCQ8_HELVI